jgi:hypothetical protein
VFLPLYQTMQAQYADAAHNPNLRRLANDNLAALTHLGFYLGFLAFEVARGDWRNVRLILTVGLVNGIGWAAFQNWSWAKLVWPGAGFNFWRCWESSGGISIGLAYGLAFYFANRPVPEAARTAPGTEYGNGHPNLERFGAYLGLILGLGLSLKNGFKGWANIYLGKEEYWNNVAWAVIGPLMLVALAVIIVRLRRHLVPRDAEADLFPHAGRLIWLVLIVQNLIAQFVTGPLSSWNEVAFSIYYVLLFFISAVIVHHDAEMKRHPGMVTQPSLAAI